MSDLVQLYGGVLDLCRVTRGEKFAVLTDNLERSADVNAYLTAAEQRGAFPVHVHVPKQAGVPGTLIKRTSLSGNDGAVEMLKKADIVIDMVGLLWSSEQKKLQDAGTRILMSRETGDVVRRMFPTTELRTRVEAGERRLKAAREMHIVSDAGTDVTYQLGQYPVITQYGYTDQPGRWDALPGGFLYTGGRDGGVNGAVVINVGDLIFPFKRYMSNPIKLIVESGMVTKIEGNHLDAELMRSYIERWNDPRAYAISHIGWGLDQKAQWNYIATSPVGNVTNGVDGRSFYGNVLFSTGPNAELGGTNNTGCHLDIPLRGCSLYLDGEAIVEKGALVTQDMCVS